MTTPNTPDMTGWKFDEAKAQEQTEAIKVRAQGLRTGVQTCTSIRNELAACWSGPVAKKMLEDLDKRIKVLKDTADLLDKYAAAQGEIVTTYLEAEEKRRRIQI